MQKTKDAHVMDPCHRPCQWVPGLLETLSLEDFYRIAGEGLEAHFQCTSWTLVILDEDTQPIIQQTNLSEWKHLASEALLEKLQDAADLAPKDPVVITDDHTQITARLFFQKEAYGFLVLHLQEHVRLDPVMLVDFSRLFAVAFVKAQLYEEVSQENQLAVSKLHAINQAGELLSALDLENLLAKIMELMVSLCQAQVGVILLYDEKDVLGSQIEWGVDDQFLLALEDADSQPLVAGCISKGSPLLIPDFQSSLEIRHDEKTASVESLLILPLLTSQRKVGAVCLLNLPDLVDESDDTVEVMQTISGLAATAVENAMLYESSLAQERVAQQLLIARNIQQSLLPKHAPNIPGFDIAGWNATCDETGGDYYDFLTEGLGENKLGLVIGDVSGHGIGPALVMSEARALVRAFVRSGGQLGDIMVRMNDMITEDTAADQFITLFFGILDLRKGQLIYSNAGHDEPLIYRAADKTIEVLPSTGIPLGVMEEMTFELGEPCMIYPGDVLLLMTDGVWESSNESNEEIGRQTVERWLLDLHLLSAEAIITTFQERIQTFCADKTQDDDMTMIVVKREAE